MSQLTSELSQFFQNTHHSITNLFRKPELKGLAINKDLDSQDRFCGLSKSAVAISKEDKEKAL